MKLERRKSVQGTIYQSASMQLEQQQIRLHWSLKVTSSETINEAALCYKLKTMKVEVLLGLCGDTIQLLTD